MWQSHFFTLNTATFIDSVKNNKRYHFVYLIRHYTNYTFEVFECAHFLCISNYNSYFLYFHSLLFITYFYVYILLRFFYYWNKKSLSSCHSAKEKDIIINAYKYVFTKKESLYPSLCYILSSESETKIQAFQKSRFVSCLATVHKL